MLALSLVTEPGQDALPRSLNFFKLISQFEALYIDLSITVDEVMWYLPSLSAKVAFSLLILLPLKIH